MTSSNPPPPQGAEKAPANPSAETPTASSSALSVPGFRRYLGLSILTMMADNIEHVISYWLLFDKFKSPMLGGFAVVSHWLPFLFFSLYSGSMADRFDPRRMMQIGMAIFMFVSLAWAVLFYTDTLEVWHAVVLLTLHGFAGVFWNPPAQVLLYDVVGSDKLHSAVRLSATGRWIGLLMGPGVGAGILMLFGAKLGIALNALLYLPMLLWLWHAPYGPKFRTEKAAPARAVRSFSDVARVVKEIAKSRTIVSMTLLAGGASLFIGNAYHAQMPGFAVDLGHGSADLTYSFLLAADAAGALAAGILLETRSLFKTNERNAMRLALAWCVVMAGFAITRSYWLALPLLFAAGFLELSFNAMAQTIVQINAPVHLRGAVVGVFHMFSLGFRAFSGLSIGLLGSMIGIHWSLALSAMALTTVILGLLGFISSTKRAT